MKKYLAIALVAALIAVTGASLYYHKAHAQAGVIGVAGNPNALSYTGGIYYAPMYGTWHGFTESAITVTGSSTTVTLGPSIFSLPDGRVIHPFGANDALLTPVTFDMGASAETITPTAVSVTDCPLNGDFPSSRCISFTGTFTNTHGSHTFIASGTGGYREAAADAGSNGGGLVYWQYDTGTVTLNTGGLTTTTTVLVPTHFLSMGASCRVMTTITVTASWAVGISGSTGAFCTANSTLTAGTTGIANMNSPATIGTTDSTTAILITGATSNPGAGAVRAKVWGLTPVQAQF